MLFAGAVESGFGQFIEQGVGLAVEHAVALLDGGVANGLGQVTLAGAGRSRDIVHIISRQSRSITVGIRYLASLCACTGA